MEGEGVGYRAASAMAINCGKILEVGPVEYMLKEYAPQETIDLPHHMVLPGLIDGHMHTACNIMRGLAQDTNNWMMFGLQPFDNAVTDEERDAGSRLAILEAARAPPPWATMSQRWIMCAASSKRWGPEAILPRPSEPPNGGFTSRASSMSSTTRWVRRASSATSSSTTSGTTRRGAGSRFCSGPRERILSVLKCS